MKGIPPGTDVVGLIGGRRNMVDLGNAFHPRFKKIWIPLLKSFGTFSDDQIEMKSAKPFYSNYFLAKSSLMHELCPFVKAVQDRMTTLRTIQNNLWADPKYGDTNKEVAIRIFNRSYYSYHPFIIERLAPFYFYTRNTSVYLPFYWRKV